MTGFANPGPLMLVATAVPQSLPCTQHIAFCRYTLCFWTTRLFSVFSNHCSKLENKRQDLSHFLHYRIPYTDPIDIFQKGSHRVELCRVEIKIWRKILLRRDLSDSVGKCPIFFTPNLDNENHLFVSLSWPEKRQNMRSSLATILRIESFTDSS